MYEAREQLDILKELQGYSQVDASKIEGTFEYDVLSSNSIEFAKTEVELEQLYNASFADTSWGEYLTMIAEQYGVIRKSATNAIVILKIKGTKGATVPEGSLFSTADGFKFATDEAATIGDDGYITVKATAVEAGAVGNVDAETVINIPISIQGVNSVTNEEAAYDGFDEETDDDLRSRYLLKVRTPATSGNKYHYMQWALAVDGVGQVKVVPLWNGPGTVKVIIIDSDSKTASEELIQATADYIETQRPIGATVTVVSPAPFAIDISCNIDGSVGAERVTEDVNAFFRSNGFDLRKVTLARIGKILMDTGLVNDYENLTLNGQSASVTISEECLPVCGAVVLNVIS